MITESLGHAVLNLNRSQRYEDSCIIASLRPINTHKFNIFVYNRLFLEEIM